MIPITFVIAAILTPIVLVTAFFAVEVICGLWPVRSPTPARESVRTVIVIPAHDEEAVIARTVAELKREAAEAARILVVADNCSDATAAVAHSAGAELITRNDSERRGKGFALAAARGHLSNDPPDVVIVLDADCRMDGASLRILAATAARSRRACQATNLLAPQPGGPVMVQISTLAFMIKNLVRQRGLMRLAGRVHLNGTGMALPWPVFADADLGGSNIVEDLALGLELAGTATAPILVEGARVWSPAASAGGTLVQRRRWEGGYLATALRKAPSALLRSIAHGDLRGICAALDLSIPPLALLFVFNAVAFVLALAATLVGAAAWPLVVQVAVGIIAAIALWLAWVREGRIFASGATLLRLPIYVLWKLPMYFGLARRGAPKEWLRTGP